MVLVKRIVLDVLKPHQPNGLEFAKAIAVHAPITESPSPSKSRNPRSHRHEECVTGSPSD